jgi:hypothetical protein
VRGFLHVVDLKTDVVDATVVGTIGAHYSIMLRLPVQDDQVNVAIGEMEPSRLAAYIYHQGPREKSKDHIPTKY